MQVFLPDRNLKVSASSLDDKRLLKQILECQQILNIYERSEMLKYKVGYGSHPIVKTYCSQQGIDFLKDYVKILCEEYTYRFNKTHKYFNPNHRVKSYMAINLINSQDDIYTYYKHLLITKWNNSKPKWTKRPLPYFYEEP